jgi:hypothetical protein
MCVRLAEKYYVWSTVRNPLNIPIAHKFRATSEQTKLHKLGDSGHLGPQDLIPHKLVNFIYLHALNVANIMHMWIDFHQQINLFSVFSYINEINNTENLRKPKAPAAWVPNQKWQSFQTLCHPWLLWGTAQLQLHVAGSLVVCNAAERHYTGPLGRGQDLCSPLEAYAIMCNWRRMQGSGKQPFRHQDFAGQARLLQCRRRQVKNIKYY